MTKHNASLPNQRLMPFLCIFRPASHRDDGTDNRTSRLPDVHLAACGPDDSTSVPLADARRASLARLRDTDREAWFVDDDADEPDETAGPAAAAATAAQ